MRKGGIKRPESCEWKEEKSDLINKAQQCKKKKRDSDGAAAA